MVSQSGFAHVTDQLHCGIQKNILNCLIFCEYSFQKFVLQNAKFKNDKNKKALTWSQDLYPDN